MSKRHELRFLPGLIFALSLVIFLTMPSHLVQAKGADFMVKAIPNQAQYHKEVSYFDLKLAPNQQTTLQVKVSNLAEKELRLLAEPNTGYTVDAGNEAYDKELPGKALSTAPYQLNDLLGGTQQVTIPARQSKVLSFPVTMPANPFDGVLEGALYFFKLNDTEEQATNQDGFHIKNRYAIALGLVIRSSQGQMVSPNLRLNHITVGTTASDTFSPAVKVNLENTQANWAHGLRINSKVTRKGDDKVLYRTKKEKVNMAANSNFDYAITTNHEPLSAGKYHLRLVARLDQKKWVFNRNFTITAKQAKKVNAKAKLKKEKKFNWWWLLLLLLLLILIIYGVYRLGKSKGQKQQAQSENQTKS